MQKKKFKQTEIGMIPEDWEVKEIEEVGKIITGKTPQTVDKENFGDRYPFITPRDMKGQKYILETERYLSEKGKNSIKNNLIPKNSVCVSCIGSDMGKVNMAKEESITNQQINSIVPNISADFLYYSVLNISSKIKNLGKQSTAIPILNKSQFSKIEIAVPSERIEMEKIAKILSDMDSKIELLQKLNKTLEEIGKTIFKHWFVDFEFPNKEGKPYKSSGGEMVDNELGEIPDGWVILPLDKLAYFFNGLALQKYPSKGEGDLPVIKIKELKQGITESTDKANNEVPEEYIINNGDVLFSWSGSLEVGIWCSGVGALNQHLFKVTSKIYPKWLYYYWTKQYLEKFIQIASDKATTMGHIQRKHLSESLTLIPDKNTLDFLSDLMNPIIEKIIINGVEIQSLIKTRDLLLPKLMSGKIRVPIGVET